MSITNENSNLYQSLTSGVEGDYGVLQAEQAEAVHGSWTYDPEFVDHILGYLNHNDGAAPGDVISDP